MILWPGQSPAFLSDFARKIARFWRVFDRKSHTLNRKSQGKRRFERGFGTLRGVFTSGLPFKKTELPDAEPQSDPIQFFVVSDRRL